MTKAIYFDMDGTIANLYNVDGWLDMLIDNNPTPYIIAKPMVKMNILARLLNQLQNKGWTIGIITWLSKGSNSEYDNKVSEAKIKWLKTHLNSVKFDEIHIVKYGTPKETVVNNPKGILFDDEKQNRDNWVGIAYDVNEIIEILKNLN